MKSEISVSKNNAALTTSTRHKTLKYMWKYKALYLMALPGILHIIIFKYVPMLGIIIAFQDYNIHNRSFFVNQPFVGLKHFKLLFEYWDFLQILENTILISLYDLLFGFTAPILLALMINEVTNQRFKRFVQQTVYLPHFLSWPVLSGIIMTQLLSPETGMINMLLKALGRDPIYFMVEQRFARTIIVAAGIFRDMGWGTIVYLASMSTINPNLYESASIDGAGKFKQLWYITIPSIMPVVMVLLLLKIGHFLDFGFERVWVFINASNKSVINIFDTYIYQTGLLEGRFSYTTAVGLFKSVVGLILLAGGNFISRKTTGESLF